MTTIVNLPAAAAGQTVQLKWRFGTDTGNYYGGTGWYIDTISLQESFYTCCASSADLGVTLTASSNSILAGQALTYTLAVTNYGPDSASSVTLTDDLPDTVTFVSASPGCVNHGGQVVCNLGTFPSGAGSNFTVVVTPTVAGLITNTLVVGTPTPDPNPANNSAATLTTVNAPATITVQPSSQSVLPGSNAVFQVTAGGTTPLSYQWRFNGTNLTGATSPALTVTNAQVAQAGTYTVRVTNVLGSALSSNAVLTVLDPWIIGQPQNQAVVVGGLAAFSVSAVGTAPLCYHWLKNGVNLVDGMHISGALTATLALAQVQSADTATYSVSVSNLNGQVVSSNATLVVKFPPVITTQPVGQTVLAGSVVSFSAGISGVGPFGFQWQRAGTNLVDGGRLSGAATASLVVSNAQGSEMGDYSLTVTNADGSVTSSNALLALWPLAGWGRDLYSPATIPGGLSNVMAVAGGLYHSLAIRTDGSVVAWGAGVSNTGYSPQWGQALVPGGLSNVTQVAGGYYHSLALRTDGSVAAWGAGTTNTGVTPYFGQALVPDGLSNVVALAAGGYHSLALNADGTVTVWGAGALSNNVSPYYGQAMVPPGLSNVVAVAGGGYHCLALKADGTVVAWGAGASYTGSSPHLGQADVPVGLSNVAMVAAGGYHSVALMADGTVNAWGDNTYGQTNTPAGLSNVVSIAAGRYFSLALKSDGTIAAWGDNTYGQGNVPVGVTNVVGIASGGFFALALEGDGPPRTKAGIGLSLTAGTGASITFPSQGGQHYLLEYKNSIEGTTWTPLVSAGATGSVMVLRDTNAPVARRFYRVLRE